MSNSLWPHGLQHARLPCPSLSPEVCSNSCVLLVMLSLQHWTLLSPPVTSTAEHPFPFGPATWFFLELLGITLHSSPVAYWTLSDLGGLIFLLQLTRFCHNSSLRPLCLGWPCTAWLPASLIYASPSPAGEFLSCQGNQYYVIPELARRWRHLPVNPVSGV